MKPIVLFAIPGPVGGARTESGHTVLLWRKLGIPVTVIPHAPEPDNPWRERLIAAGCVIKPVIKPDDLPRQAWLYRSIVVDFAVEPAVRCWDRLARMECKLIHVGCHNTFLHHENAVFRHRPPTAVVFQSRFQQSCLGLQYAQWGVPEERQAMIHGAFDVDEFPFSMLLREDRAPLVIGRLARPEPFKYPPTMWDALNAVRQQTPCTVRCMGWKPVCGVAPEWAECLPEGAETSREFLSACHALLCMNLKGTTENWSRVVLEAMATGVPVIADNRGGYREQTVNGQTGFLVDTPQQAAAALAKLATDESLRERIARHARQAVKKLASPETIGTAWANLFSEFA